MVLLLVLVFATRAAETHAGHIEGYPDELGDLQYMYTCQPAKNTSI